MTDTNGSAFDLFWITVVRAHVNAAGTPQKKATDPALSRSWGGFSTPIHSLTDRRGRPCTCA